MAAVGLVATAIEPRFANDDEETDNVDEAVVLDCNEVLLQLAEIETKLKKH